MNDAELIDRVAQLWIGLGGDGDGVEYCWRDLRDRVDEISDNQKIHSTKKSE